MISFFQTLSLAACAGNLATTYASPAPLQVALEINTKDVLQTQQNICLKVCWPESPTCPDGWFSNNFGTADQPCWTCCKSPASASANKVEEIEQPKTSRKTLAKTPAVPEVDVSVSITVNQAREATMNNQDICFLICLPEEPTCPNGWYSSERGDCWTCCKTPENDIFGSKKGFSQSELKH
ncbi:hypothetical protein N431DRAFT_474105 [Stipitochalara longipes BDJ]|nr:hypothetical protein N431DRAFT_474105 [Stipitochalara longipes BDJ]